MTALSQRTVIVPASLLAAILLMTASGDVWGERYLTVTEAQKLMFPQADHFEAQTIRFTREQSAAIEKQSGIKVQNLGNRIWIARAGTNLLGVLVVDQVMGKHDIIDYAVAIAREGKLLQLEVLEYRESHGGEIRNAKWREQFKGKSAASPLKLNGDIFNLSGATISCRHVTEGIKRVLATFELVIKPKLTEAALPPKSKP